MSALAIYGVAGAAVFALAAYGAVARRLLIHKLIALNLMGGSVFLVFVAAAARPPAAPDPVPHAMVITGIVVTVAATGTAVALIRRLDFETGARELPEDGAGGVEAGGEAGPPDGRGRRPGEESPWRGSPRG